MHDTVLSTIRDSASVVLIAADQLLSKIVQATDDVITEEKCALIGAGKVAPPIVGLDIDKLIALERKRLGELKSSSSPQDYFDAYTRLAETAGYLVCGDKHISDTGNASERKDRYYYRSVVWHRLVDSCEDGDECVASEFARTSELLGKSDPRDKNSALLAKEDPLAQIFRPRWFNRFERKRDEKALTELFEIQQKLWLAKYRRELEAETHMAKADAEMKKLEDEVQQGSDDLVTQKGQR